MKVDKVKVSYGVTKNLGNYESIRLEYGAEAILEADETAVATIDKVREFLKSKVHKDVAKLP